MVRHLLLGYGAGKAPAPIQRMGATVRHEGGTLGGASGEWVEKAESRASGRSGRRDQVGGWSQWRVGGGGGLESEWEEWQQHAYAETDPMPDKKRDEDDQDSTTDGFAIRHL